MKTIGNGLVPVRNPVPPRSAFASARLMALRRLVAGQALDFEQISKEDYQKILKVSLAFENK